MKKSGQRTGAEESEVEGAEISRRRLPNLCSHSGPDL